MAIAALNVVTGVLTARLLGPDGRGIFTAVTLWPQLLALIAISGLQNAVVYHLSKGLTPRTVFTAALLCGFVTSSLALGIAFFAVPLALQNYPPWVTDLARVALLAIYANAVHMLMKQVLVGLQRYLLLNLMSIAPPFFYVLFLGASALMREVGPTLAVFCLLGSAIPSVLLFVPSIARLAPLGLSDVETGLGALIPYGLRAALMDIVAALSGYVDRLILIPLISPSELGIYIVAYAFSRLIMVPQPAIASVVFASMALRDDAATKLLHDRVFRLTAMAAVLATGLLLSVAEPAIRLFYGAEFGGAVVLVRLLIIEAGLSLLSSVTVYMYLARNRPGIVSTIQVAYLGTAVICIAVLAPLYGAGGAAAGLLVAAALRLAQLLGGLPLLLGLPVPRLYPKREDFVFLRERLAAR